MARKTDFMQWLWGDLKVDRDLGRKADALVSEMNVQQQLVALRERSGLSQRAAAKLLGVSEPYIAKLETGAIKNPGVRTLAKYATVLGGRVTLRIDVETGKAPRQYPTALRRAVDRPSASGVEFGCGPPHRCAPNVGGSAALPDARGFMMHLLP
jgi:DNA-binding XRE family transcriptional regulator